MKNKKFLSIILVVVMSVFLFSGCKTLNEETVKKIASEFVEAFYIEHNIDKAREYTSGLASSAIDRVAELDIYRRAGSIKGTYEIEVDDVKIDGDLATVLVYYETEYESRNVELSMAKIGDDWKIYEFN